MGGSTKVETPKPTQQELALQQEQVNLLRDQRAASQEMMRQQELLAPLLYEQMGITPTFGENGKISGFTKKAVDPAIAMRQKQFETLQTQTMEQALAEMNDPTKKAIDRMMKERTLAALKGNLPVDPGLERSLKEGRVTLEESLRKQIGTGYATSTPGIQALADFDKRAEELRYGARTGQLTMGEQLQGMRSASDMARGQAGMAAGGMGMELADKLRGSSLGGILGTHQAGWMGPQALGQAAAGFSNPLSFYQNNRQMQHQANISNMQSANAADASLWGSLGSIAMLAMFSDRRLKSHIKRIGHTNAGLPLYSYTIFGKRSVGVMADEAKIMFPHAVRVGPGGFDMVDYAQIR